MMCKIPQLVEVEATTNFYQLDSSQPRSVEAATRLHKSPPTSNTWNSFYKLRYFHGR